MKIVFFADIHGNQYAFDSFLEQLKTEKPDKLVFCGDVFGYYYGQERILTEMRKMENLICILGNHDKYFLDILDGILDENILIPKYGNSYKQIGSKISIDNIQFLKSFIPFWDYEIDSIRIGAFHGSPENYLDARVYPDTEIMSESLYKEYQFVILGHTHHRMVRNVNNTLIINPGSLGQPRDGKGFSYLMFETGKGRFLYQKIEYDILKLFQEIDQNDNGNESLKAVLLRCAKA